MEILNNIDSVIKLVLVSVGAIATLIKLKDSFSINSKKVGIKLDLEILEKIEKNDELNNIILKDKIKKKIKKTYIEESNDFTNFFMGIAVFIGFGLWSYDILVNSESFNGWIILTATFSLLGFSMIFDKDNDKKEKEVFYKFGLLDKGNFKIGFIITILTLFLTIILVIKQDGFSFWQFVTGLLFLVGIINFIRNIKRID